MDENFLLNLAYSLSLADHLGDVAEDLDLAFMLAGIEPLPFCEDGTIDTTAIAARGGRSLASMAPPRGGR